MRLLLLCLLSFCLPGFLFLSSALAADRAAAPGVRPNIILCMADDLGWGDVGFNGNTVIQTPNLDAMASAGLRFNRFYAGAPVCSPTRGSALTGRHPNRYGIFSANVGHMRPEELTLAEQLRTLGYRTGHFGKWHLGTLTRTERDSNRGGVKGAAHYSPPWINGFEVCFSTEAKVPTFDPMLKPKGAGNTWWNPVAEASASQPYGTAYWDQSGSKVTEGLSGDDSKVIMDRAVPFIRESVLARQPFFAVIWFHAPHLPVVAGPRHTALYSKYDKYAQHYYGCITALDEQVGRLRRTLHDLGANENTLIWFCSDNGPEGQAKKAPGSAGPFRGRKRDLFEGGIRVPGLVEWPGRIQPGTVTDVPASTSDYLPTILSVLNVASVAETVIDGISLVPLFQGRMKERPEPIGFEFKKNYALSGNRFKLLHQGGKDLLFDLSADPSETRDVSMDHPDVVARMAKQLAAWRQSCRQSLP